jgi:colanic acid/amylovoran biosynthesis glycosyltransferase
MARERRGEMANAVCIVQPDVGVVSETFLRGHAERLPASVIVLHGYSPQIDGRPLCKPSVLTRALRKCRRTFLRSSVEQDRDADWLSAFRLIKPRVVLAEYGPTGVKVREACRRLAIPLVVHFHGFDASRRDVLETHRFDYRTLFRDAAAIVVVSHHMESRLISLGAPPQKIHRNPYGVDCNLFQGATPATAPPILVAMGRFVEKKCPLVTISAFAAVHRAMPAARLRMIGDGPLLASCRELVERLDLQHAVSFLGPQGPDVVRHEMKGARAFVQHSAEAPSGDCEGLPVSILEAGAAGLPVVSTRHAGIPEAIIEGETGILVDEHDVTGMTTAMSLLLHDAALAERMGRRARERVRSHFAIDHSIARLWAIIESCSSPRSANLQPLIADARCETA